MDDAEAWPVKQPPPPARNPADKASAQLLKTDKDGYLETNIDAASYDDRCSGYLDAVEPPHSGNLRHSYNDSRFLGCPGTPKIGKWVLESK